MRRQLPLIALMALGSILSGDVAAAQSKTVPGETKTVTGTVEAINQATRTLTIRAGKEYEEIEVPTEVQGFSTVKVGDRLNLRYYDNIVLIVQRPGQPDVNKSTPGNVVTPNVPGRSGTIARQRTLTATITAIDLKAPSITFTGVDNKTFSSPVKDVKALAQVKVGDKVDITWTTAVLASLEPAR